MTNFPTFLVRIARLDDAAQLVELCAQLGYPISVEDIRSHLDHILRDDTQRIWVAETDGSILAGWIHGMKQWLLESPPRIELGGLVVRDVYRHQGVGGQLLKMAEEWARDEGCSEVHLRSNIIRNTAHVFYQNRGYAQVKTQYAFTKPIPPWKSD
jgi:GNAT superfamily N-acetyltransferase